MSSTISLSIRTTKQNQQSLSRNVSRCQVSTPLEERQQVSSHTPPPAAQTTRRKRRMQSNLQIGDDVDVELSRDGMDVDLSSPHMPSPRGSCSLCAKKDKIRKRGWSYSVKKKTTGEKKTPSVVLKKQIRFSVVILNCSEYIWAASTCPELEVDTYLLCSQTG